jgi:5'-3' exonuclease
MRYSKVIVDLSNRYHACYHVSKDVTNTMEDGSVVTTGGIYTALKSFQKLEDERLSLNGEIFFLCDATHKRLADGDTPNRKAIDPEYKADRKVHPDPSFYRALDMLILSLQSHKNNSYIVRVPGYEADDLVAPVLKNFVRDGDSVLLVSNDLDWARYLAPNVDLLRIDGSVWNESVFEEKHKFKPTFKAIQLYKTFRGDSSDNIPPGLPQLREVALLRLVTEYSSLDDIFSSLSNIDFLSDSWKDKMRENRGRLYLNYQLVDELPVKDEEFSEGVIPCSFEPNKLISIYKSLGFKLLSLDSRLMQHIKPENKDEGKQFFNYAVLPRV